MPATTPRLRVVLDTNIYVSAFTGRQRRNFKIWQAAVEGRFTILVSPAIVNEMARVLRDDFQWQEPQVQQMLRTIVKVAEVVLPQKRLSVMVRDPEDNHILECAADGKADLIVSNDRDLLDLKVYGTIPIVAGPDFRHTLGLK